MEGLLVSEGTNTSSLWEIDRYSQQRVEGGPSDVSQGTGATTSVVMDCVVRILEPSGSPSSRGIGSDKEIVLEGGSNHKVSRMFVQL